MEVNDGPSEWEIIMSVEEKQDELRRLTARPLHPVLSAVIKPFVCCHPSDVCQATGLRKISHVQVAEDLSELDRAMVELTGGHSVQQMHAITR